MIIAVIYWARPGSQALFMIRFSLFLSWETRSLIHSQAWICTQVNWCQSSHLTPCGFSAAKAGSIQFCLSVCVCRYPPSLCPHRPPGRVCVVRAVAKKKGWPCKTWIMSPGSTTLPNWPGGDSHIHGMEQKYIPWPSAQGLCQNQLKSRTRGIFIKHQVQWKGEEMVEMSLKQWFLTPFSADFTTAT